MSTNFSVDRVDLNTSGTNLTCDYFVYQRAGVIIFPIFYSLVFLISVCGNSLVLYVTCQKKQKLNSTSIYMVNLAVSDVLFTLVLPGRVTYYIRQFDWPFGDLLCRLATMLFFSNTYAGIAFMTCISLDRYLAMVHRHRLQYLRHIKVVRGVCCLVWLLVSLETSPMLFRTMLQEHRGRRTCMEYFTFEGSSITPYLLFLACTVSFCLPLLVIIGCYTQINLKLSRTAKQNPLTDRSGWSRRTNNIILLILLTFVLCFSPYHLNIMQFMVRKMLGQPTCDELRFFKASLQVTVSVMNLNCCLDPVIYFFAIKTYKQRMMSLFKGYRSTPVPSSKTNTENSSSNT
ncbi:G-protein coupled receptor 183 [Salmo salar]|uniref:G-protein coupled receptor 183 n=1 Tax=Salmo salar TaxID=8030 RepID=A0A1S3NV19_SALSA|nr:G-protein coupled receptor 183 [Salmo salar]|eukprot:XP_014019252.1 PREDICTED: G-protein coupled receptor 183-like [Salmo salar]